MEATAYQGMSIGGKSVNERIKEEVLDKQPSIDEMLAAANDDLDDYGSKLDRQYLNDNGYWEYLLWRYEKSGRSLSWREKLLSEAVKWGLYLLGLKGGDIMAGTNKDVFTDNQITKLALIGVNEIMENTDLDDRMYKAMANYAKREIPGHELEPIVGKMFVGLGTELQKPETTG